MARLFILAAVMYVDDTNWLHLGKSIRMSDDNLVSQVQRATTDAGMLSQATGGALKQEKCSAHIMCWRFPNGQPRLKRIDELPRPCAQVEQKDGTMAPAHLMIPQPDGPALPIATLDVSVASKMLGVHFAPVGDGTTHVEAMRGKGMDWVDKLKTKPLPSRDVWLSFFIQILPAMYFGLATVIMSPAKLDDRIQSLYYHCLLFLG